MEPFLQQFQQACLETPRGELLLSGLVMTVVGLFLWLGGARFAGLVVGLLGAGLGTLIGGASASLMGIEPLAAMAVGAVLFTIAAILLKKLIIVLLAVVIFSFLGVTGYLGYIVDWTAQEESAQSMELYHSVQDWNERALILQRGTPDQKVNEMVGLSTEAQEKIDTFWAKLQVILAGMRSSLTESKVTLILICLGGAVAGLVLAQLLKTLVMSLCCSIVGATATIMGGMLVVFAKGTPVIDSLSPHPRFLPTLFGIMVLAGWVVQIIITGAGKKKVLKTVETHED